METDNLKKLFEAMPERKVPEGLNAMIMHSVNAAARRRTMRRNAAMGIIIGLGSLGMLVIILAVLSHYVDFKGVVDSLDELTMEGLDTLNLIFSSIFVRMLCLAFASGVLLNWLGKRFERWLDRREKMEM